MQSITIPARLMLNKHYVMLCYVMLCYVMLCYVMLCYVMLCIANLVEVLSSDGSDLMRFLFGCRMVTRLMFSYN